MSILQLLNIAVIWLFWGFLNAHFAKKKGKNPRLWFTLGILFGLLSLPILLLLPKGKLRREAPAAKKTPPIKAAPKRTDAHLKRWFYLDPEHKQIGPMEFTDLAKVFKEKQLGKESYIWGEGMTTWQQLTQLPELEQELTLMNRSH